MNHLPGLDTRPQFFYIFDPGSNCSLGMAIPLKAISIALWGGGLIFEG